MRYLIPLILLALAGCATTQHVVTREAVKPNSQAQAPPKETLAKDTAGIVGIEIGKVISAFIFFSEHGKVRPVGADECSKQDKCQAMIKEMEGQDKTILLHFEWSKPGEEEMPAPSELKPEHHGNITQVSFMTLTESLIHHVPLALIDVQGHQPDTQTIGGCIESGGIANTVPESGEFLNCYRPTRG